jgi:hypothetical protein
MKKLCFLLLGTVVTLLVVSCGKNHNFPSIPQLTFKSIYPQSMSSNSADGDSILTIVCTFKDAEGDIAGPIYYLQSNNPEDAYDSLYVLPDLPPQKNMQGDITLVLHSNDISYPLSSSSDTVTFRLYIKDKGGHTSDTVETSPIVLISN